MKQKDQKEAMAPLVPLQVRIRPEARKALEKIAKTNGLSKNDTASMCIAAGLGIVERKLKEIHASPSDLQPA